MFEVGTLLYFTPFYFKNGAQTKPKYLLVLKNVDNKLVCISLPTSKDYVPATLEKKFGCISNSKMQINCFFFPANYIITENNFSFPLDTYIYSEQIDDFEISHLQQLYTQEKRDYELKGIIKHEILSQIINCMIRPDNTNIKMKYRRMLAN